MQKRDKFSRKYFQKDFDGVKGGYLTPETVSMPNQEFDFSQRPLAVGSELSSSVNYYFDVHVDQSVDHKSACKISEIFNKRSLYVDLDFDCEPTESRESVYNDIYGPVTSRKYVNKF